MDSTIHMIRSGKRQGEGRQLTFTWIGEDYISFRLEGKRIGSNFSLEGASRWSSKGEKSMISRRWRQSLTNIPSRRGPRCLFTVLDPCPLGAASLRPKIIARHGCRHEATEMEMENPGNSVVSHRRGRSCCRGGRTGPRVRRQICLVRVRIVPDYAPISRYGISAILLRRIGEPLVPSFFFWCLTSFH